MNTPTDVMAAEERGWYVVLAAHRARGGFIFDGACGQTQAVSRQRFHRLIRLAEGS